MPRTDTAELPKFSEYRKQPDFGCSVDESRDSWLIAPVSNSRDADTLTRSNWRTVVADMERIDPNGDTDDDAASWEIHRFGHWACGWVEILIVRPDTSAAAAALEWRDALENYPVASEEDFSQLESDDAAESWEEWGADDFRRAIRDKFRDVAPAVCDAIDDADADALREFMRELFPNYEYEFDSGGCNFPISQAVDNLGRDELARFAWSQRSRQGAAAA